VKISINKKTILLILIAFTFSFLVRLIWVQQFSETESFKFNGEFMINTNDGYYWAEGARDILLGDYQKNDGSPVDSAASKLTALITMIVPFQFETVIFYLPAFLGSLLVIPIILISREFKRLDVGFISALLASIAWSYYNRTMVGYYDTDMLNIVLPTFLLWSLVWAVGTNKNIFLIITAIDILLYRWWYPQSIALELAFVGMISLYAIYQFFKYKKNNLEVEIKTKLIYTLKLIVIMLIAMMLIDAYIRVSILLILVILFLDHKYDKYLNYIVGLSIIAFLSTGGLEMIWALLRAYVFRTSVTINQEGLGLSFFSVAQTVREAGQIPFETFANRISGHTITFILSVIGYLLLIIRYRVMLLALPLVGLGFLAISGGLRFTIYAVPIMAFGVGYLIVESSKWLSSQLINDTAAKVSKYILMSLFTVGILYPNIIHIIGYKVPTVFSQNEVKILDKFKQIATREDYVVTWWDYGYPLRYYSDVKTLIDGAKHGGSSNFPISFVLNSPQDIAAKMARLDVEYTEKRYHMDNTTKWASSNIEQMTLDYGYKNTNDFLTSLETDNLNNKLPKKTRDIYLYLPNRMMGIFPTVTLFSNIDLTTGKKGVRPFFYNSNSIQDNGITIDLGNNISIIKAKGQIQIGNQIININNFAVTQYDSKGTLQKQIQTIDKNSPISVIYMKNYNQFLVIDKEMYESLYIQLFVLENYNKDLFEPVILDPLSKIYKLKI
jgi:dolichyl-diphosphooligosaccharide--protein glycosyltransferase/undecaprenyl-diphosphooligosaccharide--protein glycosyltransferase